MRAEWTAIETALAGRAPAVLAALRPPVTQAALVDLTRALACELPPALVAMLLVHDGSTGPIFDGQTFLSAAEIARVHDLRTGAARRLVEIGARSAESTSAWWQAEMIPVTDAAGDGYCVTAAGDAVYYHRHDDDLRQRGDTFEQWFALLAGRFERGELDIVDGGIWLR
jgi:cell wall assembly regulator SMI1